MHRSQFGDISIFVEVARANGFRAAAGNLKLGAGSVSEAVQRLEDRLGVRLFDRTTRKVALTDAGRRLYERSLPAILDLEGAVQELDEIKGKVAGTLCLSAARSSGPHFLDNLLAAYAVNYPNVNVTMIYDDRKVDLVTSGIDAAIRPSHMLELDTHAALIGPILEMTIVASPEYLRRRGVPETPSDLLNHDGICFAYGNATELAPWNFDGPDGLYSIMPPARIVVNDVTSLLRYAQAGLGVAYAYSAPAEASLKTGKLVSVLDGQVPCLPRYTINYLSKRHMPKRLRAFIDLAKTMR